MNFRHLPVENPEFVNNQGFINAKVVRLYNTDKTKMKKYAETLTEKQKKLAREHLRTVLKLREQLK